jgi:hypothetical protein
MGGFEMSVSALHTDGFACGYCGGALGFAGFCQQELDAAFRRVAPAGDWRAPISAEVRGDDVNVVCAAITHFTASEPTIAEVVERKNGRFYRIEAAGYRAGPAGP